MLQFAPNNRPSIREVLDDFWLTGRKPIPKQLNRPKWEASDQNISFDQYKKRFPMQL